MTAATPKACEECFEVIPGAARVCPHCGKSGGFSTPSSLALGCLTLVVIVMVGVSIGSHDPPKPASLTPEESQADDTLRKHAAQKEALTRLAAPAGDPSSLTDCQTMISVMSTLTPRMQGLCAQSLLSEAKRATTAMDPEGARVAFAQALSYGLSREEASGIEPQIRHAEKTKEASDRKRAWEEGAGERKFLSSKAGRLWKRHPDWSREDCQSIASGHVDFGMTTEMVRAAWGSPEHVNTSVYPTGQEEQWVYGGGYAYFKNDKLTSIQKSH